MSEPSRAAWASGPVAALVVGGGLLLAGMPLPAALTGAITAFCAAWWAAEPIPLAATALLPFGLLPLLGIIDAKSAAAAYGDPVVLLMLGGFLLSAMVEHSGAHERLAVGLVRFASGRSGRFLVVAFMLATGFVSMWISNTATTLVMMPVGLALISQDERHRGGPSPLAAPLVLGIAYASSIGGIGTPVGTPPNLIFAAVLERAGQEPWSFLRWMGLGVPVVAVLLPLAALWLSRHLGKERVGAVPVQAAWRPRELRTIAIFGVTALLWMTRTAPFGGWSGLTGLTGADDGSVALMAVFLALVLPNGEGGRLLTWKQAERVPWGLLILFGGGIAIARAFEASGFSAAIGDGLANELALEAWPYALLAFVLALSVSLISEFTSNTATASLLLPILATAALAAGLEPAALMLPATIGASASFMLPAGCASNAIAYGTGLVPSRVMIREGIVLDVLGAVVAAGVCALLL